MDSKLIKRVQSNNDHQAFTCLMNQYQSPIRQFLRRLVQQDRAIADELAQETFFKAFMHIKTYRGDGKFLSWLFKIAYQQFVNTTRKKFDISNSNLDDPADDGNFEQRMVAHQTVKDLLKQLKPDERATLILHYSHDLSHQDIADIMQIPLGTVKSLIRRSKLKLQALTHNKESNGGKNGQ
jgi:RNA polymerase sigma-70 factor (ECF subfamily)